MSDLRQGPVKPRIIYLAGPEVFLSRGKAEKLGARKKQICKEYGFDARFPLDDSSDTAGTAVHEVGLGIFDDCVGMMDECDLVIANMTPFRGISMDVGTAVELGYMYRRGKPVFGYTNVVEDYPARVKAAGVQLSKREIVENYGFSDNLMCEGPVRRSTGNEVVRCRVPQRKLLTALDGFEICVRQAQQLLRVA